MKDSSPTLVIVLVDALAATQLEHQAMPFLHRLAREGKKISLDPSPYYAGIDPVLYGVSGLELGRFTGYCFDSERSPYAKASGGLSLLDRLPRGRAGKLTRNLGAKKLLKSSGGGWLAPQLFPSEVLAKLAPPPATDSPHPHIVHGLEQAGLQCRWYTRDFPYEGRKWLGSQLFALRHQRDLFRWILETDSEGPPALVLFELSVELDRMGHRYGPRLEGPLLEAARRIDRQLCELWRQMCDWPRLHWLVVSDHGMSQVERTWDLRAALQKAGLWDRLRGGTMIHSTSAQFSVPDVGVRNETMALLNETGPGIAVSYDGFKEVQIPDDNRWGDLVFLASEGTLLLPNHFQGRRQVAGMHGYHSSEQESSRPVAVLWGEQWPKDRVSPRTVMQALYPLITELFGL